MEVLDMLMKCMENERNVFPKLHILTFIDSEYTLR